MTLVRVEVERSLKNAMERKTIKFEEKLAQLILDGKKTSTWRLFDDKNLVTGDKLSLVNSGTGNEFARAIIINVREKEIEEIEESDYDTHERYEGTEEMINVFKKYYGERVNKDTLVKIIDFDLE